MNLSRLPSTMETTMAPVVRKYRLINAGLLKALVQRPISLSMILKSFSSIGFWMNRHEEREGKAVAMIQKKSNPVF